MISRHSRTFFLTIFVILLFSFTAFAQIDREQRELERHRDNQKEFNKLENEKRMREGLAEIERMRNSTSNPLPPVSSAFKPKSADKTLLEPSPEDKKAYAIFLNQP